MDCTQPPSRLHRASSFQPKYTCQDERTQSRCSLGWSRDSGAGLNTARLLSPNCCPSDDVLRMRNELDQIQ